MKVTKTQLPMKFQPIKLNITIESEEEYAVLNRVASHEVTVPKVLVEHGIITKQQQGVLCDILTVLQKHF